MNRILLAGALLCVVASSASAADISLSAARPPGAKQLRALYADIVKPVEATRTWFKKPLAARLAAERDADALVLRVEKTFGEAPEGPVAACRNAAIQQRMYVAAMNNMVALSEGQGQAAALDLLSAMNGAVAYGQASADCRRHLESLLPEGQALEAAARK